MTKSILETRVADFPLFPGRDLFFFFLFLFLELLDMRDVLVVFFSLVFEKQEVNTKPVVKKRASL